MQPPTTTLQAGSSNNGHTEHAAKHDLEKYCFTTRNAAMQEEKLKDKFVKKENEQEGDGLEEE